MAAKVTLTETLNFKVEIPCKGRRGEIRELCRLFAIDLPDLREADTFVLDWEVDLNYIGDVQKRIQATLGLLEKGGVAAASAAELMHGRSLLWSLLTKYDEFIALSQKGNT